jgi:hypothetical protein|tara:strand:+ start:35259 stop:37040 length:1782 start_codon:yes stop_codon:yes gene_type:complete
MKKLILFIIIFLSTFSFLEAQVPTPFRNGVKLPLIEYLTLTTTERNAFSYGATDRVLIYNETTEQFEYWNGSSWSSLNANGYIPLTGTEVGSPVTGDIVFGRGYIGNDFSGDGEDSSIALVSENTTAGFWFNEISDPRPEMVYGLTNGGVEDYYSTYGLSRYQATLRGDDPNYRGLVYADDYSSNYVARSLIDLGYLQSYVTANTSLNSILLTGNDSYQGMSIGNSFLIHSSNVSPSQGLQITVDEDTNGTFPISLYPNNVASPGLILGGTPNFPISFVVSNAVELAIEQSGVRVGTYAAGYRLPKTRGTSGQVLTMGSNQYASWQNPTSADNALNYVTVTDSIYTLQEADILAYKPHIIETYRADGTTQADTVTITYPRDIAPPTNEMLAVSFTNISGSAIKIVPDSTVVIDKRTKTQRQYVLPKDYLGSASLFSVSQDTIWANGADWVISDYTYSAPSSGCCGINLNGTFDDSTNLTVPATWTVSGGVANYNGSGEDHFVFTLSENIVSGDEIEISLDVSNSSGASRFRFQYGGGGGETLVPTAIRGDGSYTFTYTLTTTEANANLISIRGSNSGGGGSFTIDNVSVTKLN